MIFILSPSKEMNFKDNFSKKELQLEKNSQVIINEIRKYIPLELSERFGIKLDLAKKVQDFYTTIGSSPTKEAILAYNGAVFKNLNYAKLANHEKTFFNEYFLIFSALYGPLCPEDAICEYRLDMKTKVFDELNLYKFWGNYFLEYLLKRVEGEKNKTIINLASKEFAKLIQRKDEPLKIIDIHFLQVKDGKTKNVATYSKIARGLFGHYVAANKITTLEELKGFHLDGYSFDEALSDTNNFYFTREK